jgi:ABC-type uncharacterized transport system YnjBCD substrate-binding protein
MKRVFILMGFALVCSIAAHAQNSTSIQHKHKTHSSYDTVPNPADSTKFRKWDKDKMPGNRKKNWPDSMGRTMPDSLRRPE